MKLRRKPDLLRQFFAALFIAALVLNWSWEMAQMSAYCNLAGRPWQTTVLTCTLASLGDAAITLGLYVVGALATRRWRWGMESKWKHYAWIAALGVACAVVLEWGAIALGRWSYNDRMPMGPVVGVGLWPLLQLMLLVPLALRLATWWTRRAK